MIKDRFFLLAATFFWGCAFVAQRVSTDTIGAFAFNGIRFWIGALSIVPVVWWVSRKKVPDFDAPPSFLSLPAACAILGFILFAGASLQQIGMFYTTAGKAGFITALYIVVVPILGLFLRNPLRRPAGTGRRHFLGTAHPDCRSLCPLLSRCLPGSGTIYLLRLLQLSFHASCRGNPDLDCRPGIGHTDSLLRHFLQRLRLHPADCRSGTRAAYGSLPSPEL